MTVPIPVVRPRGPQVLLAYLLIPLLVAITTIVLYQIQYGLIRPTTGFIRPFGVGYMFAVVLVTGIGGKRPGCFCLIVSIAATAVFLVGGRHLSKSGIAATTAEFLFMTVSGLLAVLGTAAIRENAAAYRTAQTHALRAAALGRIEHALRTLSDPVAMQQTAVSELAATLGADRCLFVTFDVARGNARIDAEYAAPASPPLVDEFPFSDLALASEQLLPDRSAIAISDVSQSTLPEDLRRRLVGANVHALLSVPFFDPSVAPGAKPAPRSLIASLTALVHSPREWTAGELHLLEDVALRLRSAVAQAYARQREKLVTATLQEALLPTHPESVPGLDIAPFYKPALEEASVGGDYYDVFRIRDGHYALVVGDISGKGLPAAVEASTVRNMLRVLLFEWPSVADAVTRLNSIITQQGMLTGFTTLFVGVYARPGRTLTYVSCGHEPALLCRKRPARASQGIVQQLDPTGPILGAGVDSVYEQHSIALEPGDTLALYTDGVTDIGPDFEHLLGVNGLRDLLLNAAHADSGVHDPLRSAGEILDIVLRDVNRHGGAQLRDDACLLIATVLGNSDAVVTETIRGTHRQGLL